MRPPALFAALSLALLVTAGPPAQAAAKGRPDLKVQTVVLSTSRPTAAATLGLTVVVRNLGRAKAPASATRVVLSSDRAVSANDRVLATLPTPGLASKKSATLHTTVVLPAVTGAWNVLAAADDLRRVRESSERNNVGRAPLSIIAAPPPPLPLPPTPVPPTPQPDPADVNLAFAGDPTAPSTITVTTATAPVRVVVPVRNAGSAPVAASQVQVSIDYGGYASTQWNSANPPALVAIPALAPGATTNVVVDVPLRSPDDVYRAQEGRISIWIDPSLGDTCCGSVAETDENDNTLTLPVAMSSGPTYAAGNLPDLGITGVSASTVHTNGTGDKTSELSVALANNGPTGARGDKQLVAQIGSTPAYDPNAPSYSVALDDVGAQSHTIARTSVDWTGPIPDAPRYAIVCANRDASVVPDEDLADNCASTQLTFDDTRVPPTPVPGDWPAFPNPANPLTVAPTVSAPSVTRTYTWDDSRTVQPDQLTAGPGVSAAFTFTPKQTFNDALDFTAAQTTFGSDFPFTTNLGAIDIEPGDVQADRAFPVTFTLTGDAAQIPADELVAFFADSDGTNFRLAPVEATGTSATVTVMTDHLGIVGIARASAAQIAGIGDRWATHPDQQLEQIAAAPARAQWLAGIPATAGVVHARSAASSAAVDPVTQALIDATLASYNQTVVPAFAAAVNDPSTALAALQLAQLWVRAAYLSGANDAPEVAEIVDSVTAHMHETLRQYADWVAAQCDGGGFAQYAQLLATMRLLQMDGQGDKSAELQDISSACSKFRVTLDYAWTDDNAFHRTDDVPMSNPEGWTNAESAQESGHLEGTYDIDLSQGGGGDGGRNLVLAAYTRTYASDYVFRTYDNIKINGTSTPAGDGAFTVSFDPGAMSLGTLRKRAGGQQPPHLGLRMRTTDLCALLCAHYTEQFSDVDNPTPITREGDRPVQPPWHDPHLIATGNGWSGVLPMAGTASNSSYLSTYDHTDPYDGPSPDHYSGSHHTTERLSVTLAPAG